MSTLKVIGEQNAAFSHAISIISGSLKSQGINISEQMIEIGIHNLRESYGSSPRRDKLVRDLLFGDPNSAPVIPDFKIIRGGKDDSGADPA